VVVDDFIIRKIWVLPPPSDEEDKYIM